MLGCNCTPTTITTSTSCDDCLVLPTVRYGCGEGPSPCGDTLVLDIAALADVTASACGVDWSIKNYDANAFDSVTIDAAGVMTVITSSNYVKSEEFCIEYKANSTCSILSASAEVFICMKDLCLDVVCADGCDQCTGTCITLDPEVSIDSNNEVGIS